MPEHVAKEQQAARIVPSPDLAITVEVGDVRDLALKPAPLRLAGPWPLAQTPEIIAHRADRERGHATQSQRRPGAVVGQFERSEITTERRLLGVVDPLVVKDEDGEAVHSCFDSGDRLAIHRLTEVNAVDFSKEV